MALPASRIRITIFSPKSVGQTLTRKSMDRVLVSFILMRPSCGTRRSAMFSADMILKREISAVLDVFSPEPLPASSPLWHTPNLVITPHCSSDDTEAYTPRTLDLLIVDDDSALRTTVATLLDRHGYEAREACGVKAGIGGAWLLASRRLNRFDPTSPFGGYKESGFGREGGRHGLAAYLRFDA